MKKGLSIVEDARMALEVTLLRCKVWDTPKSNSHLSQIIVARKQ